MPQPSDGNADGNAGEVVRLTANDGGAEARNPYSWMLGHAGIKITLDAYAHVLPTMQREAARVMGELLGS